tara:strand:+ start:2888 stop:3148 length:261 start_codon:yes stop_codon:yes gene_type:complete
MERFETKRLLKDKIELSSIIANINDSADYEQYLQDQLGPNQLKSQTGERIERNIDTMREIKRKLDEVHAMMSEVHEDNVCVNAFKL